MGNLLKDYQKMVDTLGISHQKRTCEIFHFKQKGNTSTEPLFWGLPPIPRAPKWLFTSSHRFVPVWTG